VVDVSTTTAAGPLEDEIERRTDLHALLSLLEADSSLFQPGQLSKRLIALDELDAGFGGFECEDSARCKYSRLHQRAKALRIRLEAANAELYQSVRADIVRGGRPLALLQWLENSASESANYSANHSANHSASYNEPRSPLPGLGFDYLDEFLSGVLQLPEPSEPNLQPSPEMVPYQPTPVRHILHLIAAAMVAEDDVFVDLGSGLGHVPLLVSMITGAQSLGIEMQAAYVVSARECAQSLQLSRVQFIARDARDADLSRGTVFYLYSPFKGSILADVLGALRRESMHRSIKICSLGPCTHRVSDDTWLKTSELSDTGSITVFDSL
jgi:Histone methylation protein DOT1